MLFPVAFLNLPFTHAEALIYIIAVGLLFFS